MRVARDDSNKDPLSDTDPVNCGTDSSFLCVAQLVPNRRPFRWISVFCIVSLVLHSLFVLQPRWSPALEEEASHSCSSPPLAMITILDNEKLYPDLIVHQKYLMRDHRLCKNLCRQTGSLVTTRGSKVAIIVVRTPDDDNGRAWTLF